jgi:hypothetical protein
MAMMGEVEKTAAFAAHLRALTEPLELPTEIAAGIRDIAEAIFPGVSQLPDEALAPIRAGIVALFRQAADLLERPGRPPGWLTDDPVLLQAQGRGSSAVAIVLGQVAKQLDGLEERLEVGGAFCDVGTGVGWLAITAARQWPNARVIGIDIQPKVLALADKNLNEVGFTHRVELRRLDVCSLGEDSFDLIWLPGPFLPAAIVPKALRAAYGALMPGGWVAFGTYPATPDAIATAVANLRTIRSGGYPWTPTELLGELADAGFSQVREVERAWNAPVGLVVGRRAIG